MKKILLMSLCLLVSSIFSARFSYAFEERDFIYELQQLSNIQYELSTINDPISMNLIDDEFVLDYIDASTPMIPTMNEEFVLGHTEADNSTTNKNPDDSTAENILTSTSPDLFMMPPPPSKPKSCNGRKNVELTEIEKNEIRSIYTADVKGLKNLNKRDRNTWKKIFNDGLSLEDCLKRRLGHKRKRLKNNEYHSRPEVKKSRKEYHSRPEAKERRKKHRNRPEIKERLKEYNSRPEVKEHNKKYRKEYNARPEVKKRKRDANKRYAEIDTEENNRPTKKRKIE